MDDELQVDLAFGGRPPGSGRFTTLATRPNVLCWWHPDRRDPAPDGCRARARPDNRFTLVE